MRFGRWPWRRRLKGKIHNISDSGIGLELDSDARKHMNQSATVTWDIPSDYTDLRSRRLATAGTFVHNGHVNGTARYGVRFDQVLYDRVATENVRIKKWDRAIAASCCSV